MVSSSSVCMLSCAASERVEISLVSLFWWDATHCNPVQLGTCGRVSQERIEDQSQSA